MKLVKFTNVVFFLMFLIGVLFMGVVSGNGCTRACEDVDICTWDVSLPLGSPDNSGCGLCYNTPWPLNTETSATCTFDGGEFQNQELFISINNDIINCTLNGELVFENYFHEYCAPVDPRVGGFNVDLSSDVDSGANELICYVKDRGVMTHFDACVINECETNSDCNYLDDNCYDGVCEEGECVSQLDDTEGPSIFDLLVNPAYNNGIFDISAIVDDECSPIQTAEYFLRHSGSVDCGDVGTGTTIYPEDDGSFDLDKLIEDVKAEDVEFFEDGSNRVCMQGQDKQGIWGDCECYYYESDTWPPELIYDVYLNDVADPEEYLICGDNPILYVTVCDSESEIQGGEFFLNMLIPPMDVPAPWSGYWLTPMNNYSSDGWHCSNLEGQVYEGNFSGLEDGTHYINQIRGKDIVENWGKVWGQNFNYSFIKDTTAPIINKTLNPFEGDLVECYGYEEGESNVYEKTGCQGTTNGCYYVKQGTTIILNATDPDPQETGEFAGNVIIHYIVWWKNNSGDAWVTDQQGQSNVDEGVIITLNKDSYHLVEYWAVDGCGWGEDLHYFELDIVDTVVPETTKRIIGPQYYNESEDKLYIDGVTVIELTCVDPEPHPVNDVSIYYRYRVDDGEWPCVVTEYTEPFSFPEESKHELEYYCVDALGNEEVHQFEIDYVDHTKPITTKTYGTPLVESPTGGYPKWITSQTPITLTADDGDDIHDSGVAVTYWRNTLVPEEYCWSYELCQGESNNNGVHLNGLNGDGWNVYTGPFFKPEQSCHLIEYYSVDNVEKTEVVKKQCVFVDNSAPETVKTVGEPKVLCRTGEDDSGWCDLTDGVDDYWVTQETEITLDCSDIEPHPVGYEKLCYKMSYDEPEWLTEQYCDEFKGGIMEGDWCCIDEAYNPYTLYFMEDCLHDLEWYCEDKLGNRGEVRVEYDNVDSQAPNITKFVILENGTRVYSPAEGTETIFVQSGVELNFCAEVVDYKLTGDDGVGVDKVWARFSILDDPFLVWNETEQAYCYVKSFDGCGKFHYEVKANDSLGNEAEWTNGIEIIVDNVAPVGEVLNPHAGNYYRDGVPFQVYVPAVDFGGDYCSICDDGHNEDCPASGVDYCDLYAIDYDFEGMNQSEIKDCYKDLWTYFMQVGAEPNIKFLGQVPYEDGVCKGTVALPLDSGMTDTVFLGIDYVDKAGNRGNELFGYHLQLALNPWLSPVTMNIDNEGPMVSITDSNLPGHLTSSGDGDNIFIEAEVIEYDSGFDGCWAEIYYDDEGELGDYVGVADIIGTEVGYNLCRINGAVPDGLESGNYWVVVNVRDELFNIGSSTTLMIVDNTRPTMSVVSPTEGGVYGIMFPVSLNVDDSQSPIADETVMFRIMEIPVLGNLFCIFGMCEDTKWVTLQEQTNGLYAKTINLTEYNITGQGRYIFDAVACDNLYVEELDTDLGFSLGNSRTDAHCRMIGEHGQVFEESRPQCDDGIDNDLDGDVDYSVDGGCYSSEDDDEEAVCGNEYVEEGEECEDDEDCGEGFCSGCVCVQGGASSGSGGGGCSSNSVKINEFIANPVSGNDWVELYNKGNSSVDLDDWSLNDSLLSSPMVLLSGTINGGEFIVFEVSSRLNSGGDTIKLINPSDVLVDEVTYGTGVYDASVPQGGESTGRSPDGEDTGVDSADFIIFTSPTQGSSN